MTSKNVGTTSREYEMMSQNVDMTSQNYMYVLKDKSIGREDIGIMREKAYMYPFEIMIFDLSSFNFDFLPQNIEVRILNVCISALQRIIDTCYG